MQIEKLRHIFREYDIRGIMDKEITDDFVQNLGIVLAQKFLSDGHNRVLLGYDTRKNSAHYHDILAKTLSSFGLHVISLGLIPSPCLYFAIHHLQIFAGIMVTASHNPAKYNGFKIWANESTLAGTEITDLYDELCFLAKSPSTYAIFPQQKGIISQHDIRNTYIEKALATCEELHCKVVIDGANGAGASLCVETFEKAKATVYPLFCEEEENFPNHAPDPTKPENLESLCKKILEVQADYGIALDGDGDRVVLVDKNARILKSDELMSIFIQELAKTEENPLFLLDVKCSQELIKHILRANARYKLTPTGHSILKKTMLKAKATFGGEFSGHFFHAKDWYKTDDGILTALRAISILQKNAIDLTQIPTWEKLHTSHEITLACKEEHKKECMQKIIHALTQKYAEQNEVQAEIITIDGIRVNLANAWFLVRSSNTSPYLTLRFEAKTQEEYYSLQNSIISLAQKIIREQENL